MVFDSSRDSWPVRFFLNRSGRMKLYAAAVCEAVYGTLEAMAEKQLDCQVSIIYFDSDVKMVRNMPVSARNAMELLDPDDFICSGRANIPLVFERVRQICREDQNRAVGQKKSVNFFFDVFGGEWQKFQNDHSMDSCAENWFVNVDPGQILNQQNPKSVPLCNDLTKYLSGSKICGSKAIPEVKPPEQPDRTAKRVSTEPSPESIAQQIMKIIQMQ